MGRSVSWLLAARLVSLLTSIPTASVLARLLSPADFGMQAIIGIVLLLSAALAEGTFAVPLLQRPVVEPELVASATWLSAAVGLGCMGALVAAAPLIGLATHAMAVATPLVLTAFILPLRGLSSVGVALLERRRDYRAISLASMAGNLLYMVLAIAMSLRGFGLWSLVVPTLAQVVLEAGLNTARARLPLLTAPSLAAGRSLLRDGGASSAIQLLNWAGLNAPSLIASNLLGPFVLGFYARAVNLQNMALQLSGGPVGRVLVPTFASLQGEREALRTAFRRFMGVVLPLNALATVGAVVHAEAIVRILLGRKWFAAVPVVQLLFLGFLPRSAYKVSEALALGSGRFGGAAGRQGFYFAAVCTGALAGGRLGGVQGLALGVALAVWLFYAVSLAQAEALTGAGWDWLARAHGQALLLALVVGVPDALAVDWIRHLRHPANPASFKGALLILLSHAGGAAVGGACLLATLAVWRNAYGPQAERAWERTLLQLEGLRAGSLRLRPSRAVE